VLPPEPPGPNPGEIDRRSSALYFEKASSYLKIPKSRTRGSKM
jgi:hypothetical protein